MRVVLCLLIAALLTAISGCSDGDKAPVSKGGTGFAASYAKANASYVQISEDTGKKADAAKGNEAAALKLYAELAKEVDGVRRMYADLPTPAQVAPQVSAVVRILSEQVTLLRRIGPEVEAKDSAALQAALKALSDSTVALAQARVQLEAAVKACGTDCS